MWRRGLLPAMGAVLLLAALAAPLQAAEKKPDVDAQVDALIKKLRGARSRAAYDLAQLGPAARKAVPALIRSLDDASRDLSSGDEHSVNALGAIGPAAVPDLIRALQHESPFVRGRAAMALERIRPRPVDAIPALADALDHKERDVVRMVIRALGEMGPDAREAIPALVDKLKSKEKLVSAAAVQAMMRIDPSAAGKESAAVLAEMVESDDPALQQSALYALGTIGPPASAAAPSLVSRLGTKARGPRSRIVHALSRLRRPAIPALTGALTHDDDAVRAGAAEALFLIARAIGPDAAGAAPALIAALKDPEPKVRSHAAEALGCLHSGGDTAARALAPLLRDKDPSVRGSAARGLGRLRRPDVVPALAALLKDDSDGVRKGAAQGLAHAGPVASDAVPALIAALSDQHKWVRYEAARALENIGPDAAAAIPELARLAKSTDGYTKRYAVRALGRMAEAHPKALAALIDVIEHADAAQRLHAATVACRAGLAAKKAMAAIAPLIKTARFQMLPTLLDAVGDMGPHAAPLVPALLERLDDPRASFAHFFIVPALGKIGAVHPRVVPTLIELHKKRLVHGAAARALGQIGPPAKDAVPLLKETLRGARGDYWGGTAEALARIGPVDDALVRTITDGLTGGYYTKRVGAARAVAALGPKAKSAIPILIRIVDSADHGAVRGAAAQALGQIGPPAKDAVPVLVRALRDTDFEVRGYAGAALVAIDMQAAEERAIPALIAALRPTAISRSTREMMIAVAEALGVLGPKAEAAVPALEYRATDEGPFPWSERRRGADDKVRHAARKALEKVQAAPK